jgi:hypothetical protein
MSEQNYSIRLRNSRKQRLGLHLEPWGELHMLESGKTLCLEATGPVGSVPNDMLEIESHDDGITVFGWGGSGVTVRYI